MLPDTLAPSNFLIVKTDAQMKPFPQPYWLTINSGTKHSYKLVMVRQF